MTIEQQIQQCEAAAAALIAARRAECPAEFDVYNGPKAPKDRNLTKEYEDTLAAQIKAAPQVYANELKYRPLYDEMNRNSNYSNVFGPNGLMDVYTRGSAAMAKSQNDANEMLRSGDINQLNQYGASARDAIRNTNPENARLLDELHQQAQADLYLGSRLNAGDQRNVEQASRAASGARGLAYSPRSAADEVMMNALAGRAEQDRRRQFAAGIYGMSKNAYTDPIMSIMGRQSGADNTVGNAYNQSANSLNAAGPKIFNPESAYASDLYNTNYNGRAAASIAGSNMIGSIVGSTIGAVGKVAAGFTPRGAPN